jgi:hypothetical protein
MQSHSAPSLLGHRREDDAIMNGPTGSEGICLDFRPMSPEERDRMMQSLLNQQAQFAADFAKSQQRFDAEMNNLSGKTDRIAEGLIGLTSIVGQLAASQQRTDDQLRELRDHLRDTDARLTNHIDRVESHLNVVIEMFERHLRDDHGRPPVS